MFFRKVFPFSLPEAVRREKSEKSRSHSPAYSAFRCERKHENSWTPPELIGKSPWMAFRPSAAFATLAISPGVEDPGRVFAFFPFTLRHPSEDQRQNRLTQRQSRRPPGYEYIWMNGSNVPFFYLTTRTSFPKTERYRYNERVFFFLSSLQSENKKSFRMI